MTVPVFRFNVGSTIANWALGLCLGVPAAIILVVQLPMMQGGSDQAAINVKIAAVLLTIALAILTSRARVTFDTAAKTVRWTRHLFGVTWSARTIAADQFVAMAALKDSGRTHLRTIWLIGRSGKRAVVKSFANVHQQVQLERYARDFGWSVESG